MFAGGGDGRGSGESGKNSNNGSVIDLSASSWQDDPFLDVLAAGVDRGDDKGPTTKTVTDGSAAWEGRRSSSRTGSVSDPSHGHGQRSKHQRGTLKKALSSRGGDSRNNEGGDKATDRRRPAAPLTSISALFGGGAGGNLANGSSRWGLFRLSSFRTEKFISCLRVHVHGDTCRSVNAAHVRHESY